MEDDKGGKSEGARIREALGNLSLDSLMCRQSRACDWTVSRLPVAGCRGLLTPGRSGPARATFILSGLAATIHYFRF